MEEDSISKWTIFAIFIVATSSHGGEDVAGAKLKDVNNLVESGAIADPDLLQVSALVQSPEDQKRTKELQKGSCLRKKEKALDKQTPLRSNPQTFAVWRRAPDLRGAFATQRCAEACSETCQTTWTNIEDDSLSSSDGQRDHAAFRSQNRTIVTQRVRVQHPLTEAAGIGSTEGPPTALRILGASLEGVEPSITRVCTLKTLFLRVRILSGWRDSRSSQSPVAGTSPRIWQRSRSALLGAAQRRSQGLRGCSVPTKNKGQGRYERHKGHGKLERCDRTLRT